MTKFTTILSAGLAALTLLTGNVLADGKLEKTDITIGLPVTTSTFLPLYLANEEGFFKEEGLNVKIVAFRGGTDLVRGMIAGAVDVGVTSLAGVTIGIKAKQPIKAFYGGFNMAVFDWHAVPGIKSIKDAKGKRFGVTRVGSSTDFLTRFALKTQGLDPETDVQIVQGGGSVQRLAAMEAGQIDVNIFATPEKFMAADRGFPAILKQTDVAPDYPFHVFFATEDDIKNSPNTMKAVLRAFIKGVRVAKANKARAVEVLVKRVGMEEDYASRGYDDFINGVFEDGRLPSDAGMKTFWEIGIEAGVYKEAWTMDQFWISTYVDSYNDWKPAK